MVKLVFKSACMAFLMHNSFSNSQLSNCTTCDADLDAAGLKICSDDGRASIWANGTECIYDSSEGLRAKSYTYLTFTAGACYAVSRKIGQQCFHNLPRAVAELIAPTVADMDHSQSCQVTVASSECWSGAKHVLKTTGYSNCADLAILLETSVMSCIIHMYDARMWGAFFYWVAVVIGILVVIFCCGACAGCFQK